MYDVTIVYISIYVCVYICVCVRVRVCACVRACICNLVQIPEDKWSSIIISYDNMCQLDGMKVANSPLPLPPPYNEMWLKVQKVIMSGNCKATYNKTYIT